MKLDWKIYYEDSTFDSSMGGPCDAPSFGVMCIVSPDPDLGRTVLHGWDFYYWHPEEECWWGADIWGVVDAMLNNLPIDHLKQGRSTARKKWNEILAKATTDPDFPAKSAQGRERPRAVK